MRILLLSTGGKIGGEETFTRNLALALMQRGHYVEVCPGGQVQKDDLIARGINVCEIDITGRTPWAIFRSAKKLSQYVKVHNFQIVHAQAVGPALMGVYAKKFYKCRVPWIWHNHGITEFAYKYIVPRLDKLDLCISNSDYVYVMLRNHGISLGKSKRIHNGINYKSFEVSEQERIINRRNVQEEFGISSDDKMITYVGRLSPEKGVIHLLKAFEKEYADCKDISLLLVGDGVQRQEFETFASQSSAGVKMHFAGFRSDIKELLSASDLLVLPSLIETFSLTTLQAFAVGIPVVASDVGGTPEQILDDFSGRLFKSEDSDDLKEKLHGVLFSEEKSKRYVENAKALCVNYLNVDRMIDEIEEVYNKLIMK